MKLYYQRAFPVLPPYELDAEGKYTLDTFRYRERYITPEDVFYLLQYYSPGEFVNKASCLYRGKVFPPEPSLKRDVIGLGELRDRGCSVVTMGFPEYPQKWIEIKEYFRPLETHRRFLFIGEFLDKNKCFLELKLFLNASSLNLPYSIVAKEELNGAEYLFVYYYNESQDEKYPGTFFNVPVLSFAITMDDNVDPNVTLLAEWEKDLKGSPEPTELDIYFKNYMNYRKDILNAKPSDFE